MIDYSKNIMDILRERGFIKQTVFEDELYKKLGSESVSFYIGFDPTADSLHVGHFLAMMAMGHMQRAGHRPIVLIGGGTGMIGDPSGRSDLRKVMTAETVNHNCECFKKQMSKFFSFEGKNAAIMVNNADWLLDLNYIEFLRDVGVYFSVNRMLSADCYKQRMEKGLTFFEFNYMLMQAYDFLVLYRKYGCQLECGGDDQWSNILAGEDLIRRKEGVPAFAMTFELLTTSEGKKMGKTASGAVWLDPEKTSPYEFYQYFRNVEDADVEKCLRLLTFIDMDEVRAMTKIETDDNGVVTDETVKRINLAKERLAFEVTKIVHGEAAAEQAQKEARGAFGDGESMPTETLPEGVTKVAELLVSLKLAPSKGEAKRLIEGGGIRLNDRKVERFDAEIPQELLENGFVLHKGKKIHLKVVR